MEHPLECSLGFTRCECRPLHDQHRLQSSLERHHQSHGHLSPLLLHCLHHVPLPQTNLKRTTSDESMDARPVRHLRQRRRPHVPSGHLGIHVLSYHSDCQPHDDELERAHVFWSYDFRSGALYDLGETCLCRPSGVDKERFEVS